jgi:hypothetical protein
MLPFELTGMSCEDEDAEGADFVPSACVVCYFCAAQQHEHLPHHTV